MKDTPKTAAPDPLAFYRARYVALCAERDATNAAVAADLKELEDANAVAIAANQRCLEIAKRISDKRGGRQWLALKKEIGVLARAVGGK